MAVLVLARVVAIVVLLTSGVEDPFSILGGDARRYEVIIDSEGTPYRDFEVEYPPVTLFVIEALGGGNGVVEEVPFEGNLALLARLAALQLAFELAIAGLLAWGWNRRTGIAYLILGTIVNFAFSSADIVTVFAASAVMRRLRTSGRGQQIVRYVGGSILIGLGAKLAVDR